MYYQQFEEQETQSLVDQKVQEYLQRGGGQVRVPLASSYISGMSLVLLTFFGSLPLSILHLWPALYPSNFFENSPLTPHVRSKVNITEVSVPDFVKHHPSLLDVAGPGSR